MKTTVAFPIDVKPQIVEYLRRIPFDRAIEEPDFHALLEIDASSTKPLFPQDSIAALIEARELRHTKRAHPSPAAFFSNKSVLIVPGFMGSQLRDHGSSGNGLIWIDPKIYITPSQLSALEMAPFDPNMPGQDADPNVLIREDGAVPVLYAGLRYYLETGRCEVRTAAFDWRKDIDESAEILVQTIESFSAEHPGRPFFVIAHSQGSLVARRAIQLLGKETARRIVNRLILLGPASYGTFSAAFAITGNHPMIATLAHYGLRWPENIPDVLQSMSGLYQMIPWKPGTVDMKTEEIEKMGTSEFWKGTVDPARLQKYFRWAASLDTEFFNDRTSIILGDGMTPDAVKFHNGKLVTTHETQGDGTVPDACAMITGVADVARATNADHMTLPLKPAVMQSVWRIIGSNTSVRALTLAAGKRPDIVSELPNPVDLFTLAGVRREVVSKRLTRPVQTDAEEPSPTPRPIPSPRCLGKVPPPPSCRRLKVFSFDPLLAADPESLGMESVVLKLDWDEESADGVKLQPGPVGEYLEVVDYDPSSRCFYPPVDLNHPNLLAQDGMPLSETDPQFHQQMVYAVGMKTIALFERALGRTVLWSPHLVYDENDRVKPTIDRPEGEFVRRLRIYPHAMREANAYYDPFRKALLFGYFSANTLPGDKVLPQGIVFTCLSYDVIAHEMTHALLDGMHRHLLHASNPDMFAFHEAFADIVALLQHFSHPEVVRGQIAKMGGNLENQGLLGQLAQQFGEAMGMHGSLRSYLGQEVDGVWKTKKPDPKLYATVDEPHDRGAILVAAMFTAFLTIYRNRTRDLLRIATNGSGIHAPGALHPDLTNRLADEAAKAAKHLLIMAVRALDYVPPVDLTFGEYLRALITSDYDLIPGDHRLYRVAILDAFRQWGIYPADVRNLSVESLLWSSPENASLKLDMDLFRDILTIGNGTLKLDRANLYQHQRDVRIKLHHWMRTQFLENPDLATEWGLDVSPNAPQTIERESLKEPKELRLPKFDVHSVRRCRRVGPDEQERVDILIEVVQKRKCYFEDVVQKNADNGSFPPGRPDFYFRSGATIIIDPRAGRIRYVIRKSMNSTNANGVNSRLERTRKFASGGGGALGLRGNYFRGGEGTNPFVYLHSTED